EIGTLAERDDVDLRRQCGPEIVLADRLGGCPLQRVLQHLSEHRMSEALSQDLHRHLARPESAKLDRPADFSQPAGDFLFERAGGSQDAKLALEPLGTVFCVLHEGGLCYPNNSVWGGGGGI